MKISEEMWFNQFLMYLFGIVNKKNIQIVAFSSQTFFADPQEFCINLTEFFVCARVGGGCFNSETQRHQF